MFKRALFGLAALLLAGRADAVELTLWAPANFTPGSGLANVADTYKNLYAEFEKQNPDITIKFEVLAGGTEALQHILTAATAGNLPDLGVVDGFWVPRLVEGDLLQPLNDLWTAEDRADYYNDVIKSVTFKDKIYALWFYNAWRGLYYDKKFLEEMGVEAPTTWDAFGAFAEKAKENGASAVMYPGSNSELTTLHMLSMFWGLGGRLVDDAGKPIFFEGENRAALEKVYAIYRELVTKGYMPESVSTMDESAIRPFFYTRETALVAQSSSSVTQIYTDQPDLKGRLGAVNYPLPDGKIAVPVLVGWTYGIFAKDEARRNAAWKFISFITNKENLGLLNEVQGQLPVRKSIWDARPFFSTNPLMRQFKGIFDTGGMRPRPAVPIYPVVSNALSQQMGFVLTGAVDPAAAVDAARDAVMPEYERMTNR